MKKSVLVDIISYFFFLLFVYTGISKLFEIHLFKEQLISSPFLGSMATIITWGLPIGELLLAVCLFIPSLRLKAFYATLALMAVFTVYVIVILNVDNQLSCSCGGIIEELSLKQHILFNSACVFLAAVAIAIYRQKQPTLKFKRITSTSAICLFALVGWTLFTAFSAPAVIKTGMEGRVLPSFDLLLEDSLTHFNTEKIATGKPFIIVGFSPTCIHCQAETRNIIKNMNRFAGTKIYYVTTYPFDEMKMFYRYFKLEQYPNVIMGNDINGFFFPYFKNPGVPYTVVFDSKKRLKQVFSGEANIDKLAKAIEE